MTTKIINKTFFNDLFITKTALSADILSSLLHYFIIIKIIII